MKDLKQYGPWALITGASAGIGEAFAEAIAARGVNCVITARRAERLEQLADRLREKHAIEVRCVQQDLARVGAARELADAVSDLEIGMLINNAGFGAASRFESSDIDRLVDMINLNCISVALLARLLAPKMVERERGAIVNVASVLGVVPSPYQSVYGATKAFDLALSEGMFGEFEGTGVDVIALCPSTTRTEFFVSDGMSEERAEKVTARADRPEDVVALALGYLGRKPRVGPWSYVGPALLSRLLPRKWAARITRRAMEPYLHKKEP